MMAIDPKSRVLAPRFLAGIVSMPILAILFSAVGILGAYVVAVLLIGVDEGNFWSIMQSKVDVWRDVGNGIVKSFVFGVICTAVALYQGYETAGHARGRGLRDDAHRRDRVARRAGHGLRAHGVDVLDALAGEQGITDHGKEEHRNAGRPVRAAGHGGPRVPVAEGGQPGQLQRRRHLRAAGALRQHRRPEGARTGAQRRRHGRPRHVDHARRARPTRAW